MLEPLFVVTVALVVCACAMTFARRSALWPAQNRNASEREWALLEAPSGGDAVVVFRGNRPLAAAGALAHLKGPVQPGAAWATLVDDLGEDFPSLGSALAPEDIPTGTLTSPFGRATLTIERAGRVSRFRLEACESASPNDAMSEGPMQRWLADATESLVWREDSQGRVLWANRAYLAFAEGESPAVAWPPPTILTPADRRRLRELHHAGRICATRSDGALRWLSISTLRVDGAWACAAWDISTRVETEDAAQLANATTSTLLEVTQGPAALLDPTGDILAMNTEMAELTALRARDGRPGDLVTLLTSLDGGGSDQDLRAGDRLTARAKAIRAANLDDLWVTPDGRRRRAQAHSLPGHRVLVMFQDVMDARRGPDAKAMAEALDSLARPMAVFAADGTLATANAACRALWGWRDLPRGQSGHAHLICGAWSDQCAPGTAWTLLRGALSAPRSRDNFRVTSRLKDGRGLSISLARLESGGAVVRFDIDDPGALSTATQRPSA